MNGIRDIPIEKSVPLDLNYPTVAERYFRKFYYVHGRTVIEKKKKKRIKACPVVDGNDGIGTVRVMQSDRTEIEESVCSGSVDRTTPSGQDTCILIHSNGILIVTLSPRHPVVTGKKQIQEVDFVVGKVNRLDNSVSGKAKKGGQHLDYAHVLCTVRCKDGSSYDVFTGVKGLLVEVNKNLVTNPNLLIMHPQSDGYLAILFPPLKNRELAAKVLMPEEQYESYFKKTSMV